MGWEPNKSSVKRWDAPTDKPPEKPARPPRFKKKQHGHVATQGLGGNIQGMVSLKKIQRQTDGTISSWADEISVEGDLGQLTPQERHIASAYESGLINDDDLSALL